MNTTKSNIFYIVTMFISIVYLLISFASGYVSRAGEIHEYNKAKIGYEVKNVVNIYNLSLKLHDELVKENKAGNDVTQIYFTYDSAFADFFSKDDKYADLASNNFELGYVEFNEKTGEITNNLNNNIDWGLKPTQKEIGIYKDLLYNTISHRYELKDTEYDYNEYIAFYFMSLNNLTITDKECDDFLDTEKGKAWNISKEELKDAISKCDNWFKQRRNIDLTIPKEEENNAYI